MDGPRRPHQQGNGRHHHKRKPAGTRGKRREDPREKYQDEEEEQRLTDDDEDQMNPKPPMRQAKSIFSLESSISANHGLRRSELYYPGIEEVEAPPKTRPRKDEDVMPPPPRTGHKEHSGSSEGNLLPPEASLLDMYLSSNRPKEDANSHDRERKKKSPSRRVGGEERRRKKLSPHKHTRRKKGEHHQRKLKLPAVDDKGGDLSKYQGMLNAGIPKRIVLSTMIGDGVTPPRAFVQRDDKRDDRDETQHQEVTRRRRNERRRERLEDML